MSDHSPTAHSATTEALRDTQALFALLDRWVARGWLRALDRAFAAFLAREVPDAPAPLLLAAALASHQLGRGHVCLDLAQTLAEPDLALSLPPEGDSLEDPPPLPSALLGELTLADWQEALTHPLIIGHGPGSTPLVLDATRLYLRRYWHHERSIQQHIATRLEGLPGRRATCCATGADRRPAEATHSSAHTSDTTPLAAALSALFPASPQLDWQKAACALAARSPFAVITGGPGTGKTTTVVKLLALLQTLALGEGRRALHICLAVPTGKAAARLNESIAGQVAGLSLDGLSDLWEPDLSGDCSASKLRSAIPTDVTT